MTEREGQETGLGRDEEAPTAEGVSLKDLEEWLSAVRAVARIAADHPFAPAAQIARMVTARGLGRPSHFPGEHGEPVRIHDEAVELDDAYYDEVRQAVGRGAPSVLLGTSARSLARNLAEIKAVERGDPFA